MNFLVQQLKNHMPIRQLSKQGHEKANIYVEHNTHPDSQIAPYKKFLTLEARGQNRKNWFFSSLLHKNKTTLEWLRTIFEVVNDFWEQNNTFSNLEAKKGFKTASIIQIIILMGIRF